MPQQMPSSIVNLYQNQLEASRQFADAIFSGTEKIDRVVIDATHRAFTEQLEFAQALAGARDQRSLASLPSTFMPKPENAVNYQKEILQVFAEMQNDIGRSIQQYVDQIGNSASETASRGTDQAQRFSEGALNPMTGMFSVWQSAFNEVAALANRNMQAARSNFENAASSAANAATQAATSAIDAEEEATTASSSSHRRSAGGSRRK
jgi:hypothetical protein